MMTISRTALLFSTILFFCTIITTSVFSQEINVNRHEVSLKLPRPGYERNVAYDYAELDLRLQNKSIIEFTWKNDGTSTTDSLESRCWKAFGEKGLRPDNVLVIRFEKLMRMNAYYTVAKALRKMQLLWDVDLRNGALHVFHADYFKHRGSTYYKPTADTASTVRYTYSEYRFIFPHDHYDSVPISFNYRSLDELYKGKKVVTYNLQKQPWTAQKQLLAQYRKMEAAAKSAGNKEITINLGADVTVQTVCDWLSMLQTTGLAFFAYDARKTAIRISFLRAG